MTLITVEEYRLAEDIANPEDDPQIQVYIDQVSDLIETYLGRNFLDEGSEIVQVFSLDYATNTLFLDKFPVNSIVSVESIDPVYYDSTIHFPVEAASYFVDMYNGKLIRTDGYSWAQGPGAVVVTYTAGLDGDSSVVPPAIKRATIDLVNYYKDKEYIKSKSLRGASISNADDGSSDKFGTDFPPHIQKILDLYRNG